MTESQTLPASVFLKRTRVHDHRRRSPLPTALCILSVCGVVAAWGAPRASAATYTVTKLADTEDGACDADCSLSEAITQANANGTDPSDTINFATGLTGTIVLDTALGQLVITAPVVINGPGQETLSISGSNAIRIFAIRGGTTENPVTINNLTITAGNSAGGPNADTGGAVLTSDVTNLDNVTVSNSSSSGAGTTAVGGGGIFNSGALTLSNSTITGNTATNGLGNGGGVLNTGTLTVNRGSISDNGAGRAGGGIETNGGSVILRDVNLAGNSADVNGGGLHTSGAGAVTVTRGLVQNNTALQEGGGLWNSAGGTLTVDTVEVTGNEAQGAAADQGGGGIYNDGGTVTVQQTSMPTLAASPLIAIGTSSIKNNAASGTAGSGGGIFNNGGTLNVSDTVISANSANRAGGGVETLGGTVTLTNITLGGAEATNGNTASAAPGNGGGLHTTGAGNVTVTDSTVQNNLAALEGGGLWNSATGTLTVNGTILSTNQAQGNAADNGGGGIYNDGGTANVNGSSLTNNSATGTAGSGGGIFNNAGSLNVDNSTLVTGMANRAGGAIETLGGTVDIDNSNLNNNSATINGGALHITGASEVTLTSGAVQNNSATQEGGGLWNSATGILKVNGTLIQGNDALGNDADQGGGGIYSDGGTTTVTAATIRSNSATGTAGSGGGIFNNGGTLNVSETIINSNRANRAGGGIETNAGTVTLTNTTLGGDSAPAVGAAGIVAISGNIASAAPGNGGGLHTTGAGDVTIIGGKVLGNTAALEGGGLWNSATGTLKVSGTEISQNTAQGNDGGNGGGGGIYNDGGTTTVTNATLSNNVALSEAVGNGGGGIFNNGALTVTTSTLTGNTANANQSTTGRGNGGGILNTASGITTVTGGVIAANLAARAGGGIENVAGAVTLTDVLMGGPEAANGNIANINGGGLHSGGGTVTLLRGTVANNIAVQEGGGLWAAGTMNVTGTAIFSNVANGNGTKQGGGGVFVETGGTTTITGATISANISTAQAVGNGGGGIFNDARLTVTNSTLTGNLADTNQNAAGRGNGGGILNTDAGTLIVNGGTISNNRTARAGGGIENAGGTVTLSGLTLNGNFANINGGGLHSGGGTVTLSDATVQNNIATQEGGGLWAAGTMNVARGLVSGNIANGNGTKQGGGGVFVETGGTTTINGTTIRANVATAAAVGNGGGGIFSDAIANLTNVTITDNTATTGTGNGGGIFNTNLGALTINGARISGNKAARAGGGIENDGGTATLNVLVLEGNTTGINGGGFHQSGAAKTTLDKSVVYDNSANNEGGGLWNSGGGTLTVTNSTINSNAATSEGGGVYTVSGGTTSLTSATVTSNRAGIGGGIAGGAVAGRLANSIIALNTGGAAPDVNGAITSQGYNLISVGTGVVGLTSTDLSGTTAAPLDPKIGPLANNGGPTLTRTLLAGSPAINGGDPAVTASTNTDQRGDGFLRVRAGRLDIGALELQIDAPTVGNVAVSTNEDTTFTFSAATFDAGFQSTNSSNQAQTVRIDTLPANGTLALNGTAVTAGQTIARTDLGALTYAPGANFNGSDALTFSASDGFITASGATVNITVVPVNDAPVAISQQLRADNATPLQITLEGKDDDCDGRDDDCNLTFVVGEDLPNSRRPEDKGIGPVYGTLSGTAPNLTYTAPAGYVGRDVFTFYVSDGTTTSQQAKVEIQVGGERGLSAGNDSYNLVLGPSGQAQQAGVTLLSTGVFRIAAPGVLANDFAGSEIDKASPLIAAATRSGRVRLNADGSFDYLPSAGFAGTDGFTYTLSNDKTKATAQVRLIVIDRRDPELRFDTPTNGTVVKTVSAIKGRVRDRESGLKSINLLWRRFDGKFWNGSAWDNAVTVLPLTVQGINWAYTGNLPQRGTDPATDLLDGNYDLRVTTVDKSGNTTRVTNNITVRNTAPPTPEFSTVRLSSGGASAAQNTIVLRFTGALDTESAGDAMNYVVAVNGVETDTSDVAYAENVVTLSGLELNEGDEITLQISGLKDAESKALRGGQVDLIAR